MKRPASSASQTPKKNRTLEHAPEGHDAIIATLATNTELPDSVRDMLAAMIPITLGVSKDDRHPFHSRILEMTIEALEGGRAAVLKQMAEAELAIEVADQERSRVEAKREEAQVAQKEAGNALNENNSALALLLPTIPQLKADVKEFESLRRVVDKAHLALSMKRERLQSVLHDSYGALIDGIVTEARRFEQLRAIGHVGKQLECEADFIKSLLKALTKEPCSRTDFDRCLTAKFDEIASASLCHLDDALARGEPAYQEAKAKGESVRARLETAESSRVAAVEDVATARMALAETQQAATAAEVAVSDAIDAVEAARAAHAALAKDLSVTLDGSLVALRGDLPQPAAPPLAVDEPVANAA